MNRQYLNGSWQVKECGQAQSVEAHVPGSVLSAFLEKGMIKDPYDRMNEYETREMFWKDYQFEREFEVKKEVLMQEHLELVCEGLDTLAEISINGKLLAKTNNMHRTWHFPVKEYLQEGKNQICIVFRSVLRYIQQYSYEEKKEVQYIPSGCMYGNHLLRKAHSMFGWDWGPQLIDAGIFRDIYLKFWNGCRVEEVSFHQKHEEEKVTLTVATSLDWESKVRQGNYQLNIQVSEKESKKLAGTDTKPFSGKNFEEVKRTTSVSRIEINHPQLWWPNGYGAQPLYDVVVTLEQDGQVIQTVKKTIGLRELTVSRDKDEWGKEFAFMVNGTKIFTMGGNWIPEDCIYSHITKERQEYLLESVRRANFNCVRVWGGGYYPSDEFYDLCDEKGLIVWQDLMYACNVYDVTEDFAQNCRIEAIQNVKRLRHHACLGMWCGNNEIESAWHHWGDFQKETPQLRADYLKLFEDVLPKAVRLADPDTFYWRSSPSSEGSFDNPDDENNGDTHYWDVWHGQKPFTDYRKYYFRFCSEFGFQSFPGMKTVETFARQEDQNIFSKTMESHQKNDSANGKMLYYLSEQLRYPADFQSLLYATQILQGMAVKYGVDHWRRHRGRCMGSLYWQINDNWPAPSWSSIDYFGRWKALQYMACDFYAPVAVSMTTDSSLVHMYVENETKKAQDICAHIYVKDMNCKVCSHVETRARVDAFTSQMVLSFDLKELKEYREMLEQPQKCDSFDEQIFIEAVLVLEDGTVKKDVETLLPYKYMNLPKAQLQAKVTEEKDAYIIDIKSDAFAAFVELDFANADVIFSDNYFHLTDTDSYRVRLEKKDIINGEFENAKEVENQLQMRSLADSYQ